MAVRRKIGNLAHTLLQAHLQKRQMEQQSDLIKQRQMEMAQANDDLRRGQADDQRKHTLMLRGIEDPALMETFHRNNVDVGIDPTMFRTGDDKILSQLGSRLSQAKREELPTDLGIEQQLGATPWGSDLAKDPRAVKQGMTVRDDRKGQLDEIDTYQTDLKGAEAFATRYNTDMGAETASAANHPAQLQRKVTEFQTMTPLEVEREAKKAWATVPAELEKYTQQRMIELAQIGNKVEAEQLAQKRAAVKGLMPTYLTYRSLVLDVAQSWTGASGPTASSALGAIGQIPVIGSVAETGLKAAHTGVTSMINPDLGKKVGELNRLTSTLAQGMANAVLGNRGQTTENDRRTAENILATSFTDINTAKDLLKITDTMFMILPSVTAQMETVNPNVTAAEIIQATADQAKQQAAQTQDVPVTEQSSPAAPSRPNPTIGPSPTSNSALERLNRLRQGRQ